MVWVLIKLLNFQKKELEKRHVWLRWRQKYKSVPTVSTSAGSKQWRAEDLDEEFKLLLSSVDQELGHHNMPRMDQDEINIAIQTMLKYKEDGTARYAIGQAVKMIERHRRAQTRSL